VFELGNSLKEARLRQGRTFVDLAQATKIRSRYLRALEEEQFALIPAPTYVRGFLRTYAEELGLEGQLYVDEFNSRFFVSDEVQGESFRQRPRPSLARTRRIASLGVVSALAVIALVSTLVVFAFSRQTPRTQTVPNLGAGKTEASGSTSPAKPGRLMMVTVTAVRGSSWVDARIGGEHGKALFSGTLTRGHSQTFRARSIWLRVGALGNLKLTLRGGSSTDFRDRPGPATILAHNGTLELLSG
jgi:cytoskeleton protein RodZ